MRWSSILRVGGSTALPVIVLLATVPALAALGEDAASIQADQAHLRASVRILPGQYYSVHEMQTPAGTTIRQFVTPAGAVFAVQWQGSAPDLRQILGRYFDEFVAASESQPARRGRGLHLETGDLVFESGGHMRYVVGRAYLRSKMPAGVTSDDVR
ncbi:MAG TPA: DUF2844 domain-containing protein [Candidatus Sulfotelmatobacter sp.]|nr:DUF2844 domain-containing protein [Candidatus Sulfotelmatobacter sp.]